MTRRRRRLERGLPALLTVLLLAAPPLARAQEQPLWELGLGLGAVRFPAYRGASQARAYLLPVPYFVYRGRFLKADREGVRGQLWDSDRFELTLSAALSPPADSRRVAARAGMADLKSSLEFGPQLDVRLWSSPDARRTLKLQLPLRTAYTLQGRPRHIGWVLHPRLNLDVRDPPGLAGWNLGLQAGLLFGDRRQHQYFYGVAPAEARAGRPAYQAPGGYAGTQLVAALSRRFERFWVGAFLRHDNLRGARFADSPLLRRQDNWAAGVAVTWVLGESTTRVRADD